MADILNLEKKLAEYKCDTNKAIRLKLVRFAEDLEDETTSFSPLYSHQVFGDEESVFGYKDLEIQLYYSTCSLTTFFNIKYSSKVIEKYDNVEVDNVESKVLEFIPAGYCINLDEFIVQLEKDASFRPFGLLIHSYTVYDEKEGLELSYEIYKTDISCPGFKEYHERLQTFLIWFIETASFIDVDDDKWQFFLVFEKYLEDGSPRYATVGYMTVYNFYAYPDKMRPRIGQMLVLPPFQGEGHGARLLETVQRFYTADPSILDITAEEPSEDFVKLRDFVLAKLCEELHAFVPEKLKKGFSAEMIDEARRTWRINKHHSRRVYEILRLRVTNMSDPVQSSEYRLDVKRRLAVPFKNSTEFESIARGLLENKTRVELVDLLQEHFAKQARDISRKILLKIPRRDLVTKMFGEGDTSDSEGRDPEKRKRGKPRDCGTAETASNLSENEMSTPKKNKVETKAVEDKTLMALAETMGHNWKQIGIQFLELKGYVIDQCELKEATVILQSFEMLKNWKNREKEGATALKLYSILANEKCPIGSEQLECLLEDTH